MNKPDIPFLSASELSGLIRTGEVSPVEATEAYLARIEAVDSQLNSYITVTAEAALAAAQEAERQISDGRYLGPMHGIPVGVKDQFYTRGVRTTGGARVLADFVPDEDATVIAKLKEAGAVLLGKLNMSEFAMAAIYDHPYGTPRNPWDLSRNPGTSSSGSGAATAAFLCATSLGEDTGGSIRTPANWSGLAGLRPTWGRVSRHGVLGGSWSMDTVGPISRTVEDAAITFGAIAGYDPKDPYTWNVPVPDYRSALTGDVSGLKVGVLRDRLEHELVEPEFREAVSAAISELGELGASIEDVAIPLAKDAGALSMAIIGVEWSSLHRDAFLSDFQSFDQNNRIRFLTGSLIPAPDVLQGAEAPGHAAGPGAGRPVAGGRAGPAHRPLRRPPRGVGARGAKQGAGPGRSKGAHQLHRAFQPGRSPRPVRALRFQLGQPAPGSANSGPSLRGRDGAAGGPRLRTGEPLVHPEAADLAGLLTRSW